MNADGIFYTDEMIEARKQGLKSVTRRPVKPQPKVIPDVLEPNKGVLAYEPVQGCKECYGVNNFIEKFCPYSKSTDYLYVKENFQILEDCMFEQSVQVKYRVDGATRWVQLTDAEWEKYEQWKQPYAKKSKLFMFKSLARYWDKITGIEVERVQDISLEEMKAEGTVRTIRTDADTGNILWPIGEKVSPIHYLPNGIFSNEKKHLLTEELIYRAHFYALWDSMYKDTEYAIPNNPWVWVIRFEPVDLEEKAMKAELKEGIL